MLTSFLCDYVNATHWQHTHGASIKKFGSRAPRCTAPWTASAKAQYSVRCAGCSCAPSMPGRLGYRAGVCQAEMACRRAGRTLKAVVLNIRPPAKASRRSFVGSKTPLPTMAATIAPATPPPYCLTGEGADVDIVAYTGHHGNERSKELATTNTPNCAGNGVAKRARTDVFRRRADCVATDCPVRRRAGEKHGALNVLSNAKPHGFSVS